MDSKRNALRSVDIAWIAGLLEGEGCFHISGKANVFISVTMTDRDVVQKARDMMRGGPDVRACAPPIGNRKQAWTFVVCGSMAIQWMMTIYPLMGTRRKQRIAHCIRQWCSAWSKCKNGHPMSGANLSVRRKWNGKRWCTARSCRACMRLNSANRRQKVA